jgi:hypothetical protein
MLQIADVLNSSPLVFPVLECFHIAGFIVAIGTTAAADFRLLDWGFRRQTPAQLSKDVSPWMLGGLLVAIFSGLALYSSDPDMYYLNWSFLIKMACLVIALVFNYTIHRRVAQGVAQSVAQSAAPSEAPPVSAKIVAGVSLVLWASIIFGGIFIAFINPGL